MESMISNMMMIKMDNGCDHNFSYRDDDHLISPTLCPKIEDQSSQGVKMARKRKPKSNDNGQNGAVSSKRKLADDQAARLELYFESEPRLETERKERIAAELGLEPRQVAVWFQNRRARWKCKKLEDEFANLRTSHFSALTRKAQLEAQISELNGRLMEAEGEIQRISAKFEGGTPSYDHVTTAPSSSNLTDQVGIFPVEVVQLLENDEYDQMMDYWMNHNIYDIM